MASAKNEIGIHLDAGHDSIGWCVTEGVGGGGTLSDVLGAGVVLFPADDCLACKRRQNRAQRRHIRATRTRIRRMTLLLEELGVMTAEELAANTIVSPWQLAAHVLADGATLTWPELWAVLRWYAHNRGYDGNALASAKSGRLPDADDIKKNEAARKKMEEMGATTMAETMCRILGVAPDGEKRSSRVRFKGVGTSFDRSVVVAEVGRILRAHVGVLPGVDERLIHILMADPVKEPHALQSVEGLPFVLPRRYYGGLLFGQLAPRFDNRIIGKCPISGGKLPLKSTPAFLRYRWAMALAHVRVGGEMRPLTVEKRGRIDALARKVGGFTKAAFAKAVVEATGQALTNVDALMTAPDAEKSLVLLPGLYALTKVGLADFLDEKSLRVLANTLFKGKSLTVGKALEKVPEEKREKALAAAKKNMRGKNKAHPEGVDLKPELPSGRAPYARAILDRAAAEALAGKDPTETGGLLYRDATKADILPEAEIDRETNNHLVRHRIKAILRLVRDIVRDYAENDRTRVATLTIETARDMKDLSGMTNKQIQKEMGLKTAQHRAAAKKLEDYIAENGLTDVKVSAGLIRKMRVAMDLGFTCPYTGVTYDIGDVISKTVDLDHILPRSERAADSLDSLALTFRTVNELKGKRTGLAFIRECGGRRLPRNAKALANHDNKYLTVFDESHYRAFVEGLKFDSYGDDKKRQKRRAEKLLMLTSDEPGMTEGMLTRTSHITALASKALRGLFAECGRMPRIVSVPGRVTAELRMQWNLLGLLAETDRRVLDEKGELRPKQEIRGISHQHHAVDAITLGLAATLLPTDGTFWATMCKRRVNEREKAQLATTGVFAFTTENEPRLAALPNSLRRQISAALGERRVVMHQPQTRRGLLLEERTWGVEKVENDRVFIKQRVRQPDGSFKTSRPKKGESITNVFGLNPNGGRGKLAALNGVLVIKKNYGVALLPEPRVIRHQRVWKQLAQLKRENGGRMPPIVRNGSLIRVKDGTYKGIWRVASVKDNAAGLALDLIAPYAVKVANGVDEAKINVKLATLVKCGLEILPRSYTGRGSCPIMSSTSQPMA